MKRWRRWGWRDESAVSSRHRSSAPADAARAGSPEDADASTRGIIERYDVARRWGFVCAVNGERLFFHRGGLVDPEHWTPRAGQHVRFQREVGPQGLRAFRVRRAEG